MKYRVLTTMLRCAMPCIGIFLAGCANLRVAVDVYTGPLVQTQDTKLAYAVGAARAIYNDARLQQAPRLARESDAAADTARYVKAVVGAYEGVDSRGNRVGESIDTLWERYSALPSKPDGATAKSGAVDRPGVAQSDQRNDVRRQLALGLLRFAGAVTTVGQERGLPPAILAAYPFVELFRLDDLTESITLEEVGRRISYLIDDVLDSSNQTTIARMMQSVSTGYVIDTLNTSKTPLDAATRPLFFPDYLARFKNFHWSEINEITISGTGTTEYVLVKDNIGNWHIKSLIADQDEVVNAIFDSADAAIGILAAQYGVAAGKDGTDPTSSRTLSDEYVERQVMVRSADTAIQRMRQARLALTLALEGTKGMDDAVRVRKVVTDAVSAFKQSIDSIHFNQRADGGDSMEGSPGA